MIKIKITTKNIDLARKRAVFLKNSSRKISSGGELYGLLGEQLFLDNYGGELIDSKDYDINHPMIGKIDIKSKRCTSDPQLFYTCSVAEYQMDKEQCEFYAFYRIHNNLSTGWFLGIISKSEFIKKSKLLKKGDRDGSFICKTNCYNIPISDLKTFSQVLKN